MYRCITCSTHVFLTWYICSVLSSDSKSHALLCGHVSSDHSTLCMHLCYFFPFPLSLFLFLYKQRSCLEFLLNYYSTSAGGGQALVHQTDNKGATPIHYATITTNHDILDLLLEKVRANQTIFPYIPLNYSRSARDDLARAKPHP